MAGPTADQAYRHWYEFLFGGKTGAEISSNVTKLYFLDVDRGDDDLSVNGIVVDIDASPNAITNSAGGDVQTTSSTGGGSGCFLNSAQQPTSYK